MSINRKSCVLILPRSVFPTVSGYALKNKNVIELLSREYDLTLAVIKEEPFTEDEISYYQKHSLCFIPWVRPRAECCLGTLKSFFTGRPLQVSYYYDKGLQKELDDALAQCDVAVAVLERTVEYLKNASPKAVKVFDMVDSIGLNYERSKDKTSSPFWKALYNIEGGRLLKYESGQIAAADVTYLINQEEADYYRAAGNVIWLPHGVKPELLDYQKTDPAYSSSVAFIGKMDYQPNVDAMLWYVKNVHSVIGKDIPLIIVGASPAKEISELAERYENITVTGYMDDPYIILNSCMALIAPMQTGGGIQNKVLEGMALGKINVITHLAAAPLSGAGSGSEFLTADTPEEYINILRDIKEKPEKYADTGPAARRFIQEHFTWEAFDLGYLDGIDSIVKTD